MHEEILNESRNKYLKQNAIRNPGKYPYPGRDKLKKYQKESRDKSPKESSNCILGGFSNKKKTVKINDEIFLGNTEAILGGIPKKVPKKSLNERVHEGIPKK